METHTTANHLDKQVTRSSMRVSHGGYEFNNTSEIQDYVASFPDEEKYDVIVSIWDQFMQVHQ